MIIFNLVMDILYERSISKCFIKKLKQLHPAWKKRQLPIKN